MDQAKAKPAAAGKKRNVFLKLLGYVGGAVGTVYGWIGADQVVQLLAQVPVLSGLPGWGVQAVAGLLGVITGGSAARDLIPNTTWTLAVDWCFDRVLIPWGRRWARRISRQGFARHGSDWQQREDRLRFGSITAQASAVAQQFAKRFPDLGKAMDEALHEDDATQG